MSVKQLDSQESSSGGRRCAFGKPTSHAASETRRLAVQAVLDWADAADFVTYIARDAHGGGRPANAQLLASLALNLCVNEVAYPFDVSELRRLGHPGDLAVAVQFIKSHAERSTPNLGGEDFETNGLATRLVRLAKRARY